MTTVLGIWKRPVVYFSKLLDETSKGLPSSQRAVAATVLLVWGARKLVLGLPLGVFVTPVQAKSLPRNTSAQTAELIALTRTLGLAEGKALNVCKHAFGVLHAHGATWWEQGLLTTAGGPTEHSPEMLQFNYKALRRCKGVAVMCC